MKEIITPYDLLYFAQTSFDVNQYIELKGLDEPKVIKKKPKKKRRKHKKF